MRSRARALSEIVRGLESLGTDSAAVLAATGLEPDALDDPDRRFRGTVALALWEHAERITADPDLGLHLAEQPRPEGLFGHLIGAAPTLGEGLRPACRYSRLMMDEQELRLVVRPEHAELRMRFLAPIVPPRAIAELVLASIVVRGRLATRRPWAPRQVHLRHPEPPRTAEHQRIFRAPIRFGARRNMLVLDRETLDVPLAVTDAEVASVLEQHARERLERVESENDLAGAVRRAVVRELHAEQFGLEVVARSLGMSSRTLQRRLRDEGVTYEALVDDARRSLAMSYLKASDHSLQEIAVLVGFTEASAFSRAFRRWTGTTPAAFRATL